ncbi:pseudouridine synthase [Cercophora scortea]|uniref:Pseudouridine synthase n=1 Tax=Cercophora scortea TaxID=314031 RepID=A0AAE0I9J5_9PEZI|nr:pseudouridine synthase [Cercophora scortea]
MAPPPKDYSRFTKDGLIKRIRWLEDQVEKQKQLVAEATTAADPSNSAAAAADAPHESAKTNCTALPSAGRKRKRKPLDPTQYSTRLIALKLAYLGKEYNGFEYQTTASQPSIEEELWKALVKACLISPENPDEVDFSPYEYSKCGRTDKGVSAFGQVIGIRVRSYKPLPKEEQDQDNDQDQEDSSMQEPAAKHAEHSTSDVEMTDASAVTKPQSKPPKPKPAKEWDPISDEIPYARVLNRLLPRDIRILAWAPTLPENFSARFSCRERQYRYFFTQPAFAPLPHALEGPAPSSLANRCSTKLQKGGWLDIDAMRQAAKLFEGAHDFRNFCKIDPAKQITNFMRRVFEADIHEVEDVDSALPFLDRPEFRPAGVPAGVRPKVYYFHVRGSAFLWHQIRHMVSILFLVGQGLEAPSVVSDLLNATKYPRRPNYLMADEVPLVLWDCIFPDLTKEAPGTNAHLPETEVNLNMQDGMDWVWMGEDNPVNLHGSSGLVDQMWENWREKKMDELLANRLLECMATKPDMTRHVDSRRMTQPKSQKVFEGGNAGRYAGTYLPVMKRNVQASVDEMNDKWAQARGFASAAELARTKNWRTVIKEAKRGLSSSSPSDKDEVE